MKPSQAVTPCFACGRTVVAQRADARYCSGRCRQRASRARQASQDIDREIEAARLHYWTLVRRKAAACGISVAQVLAGET